jgi:hypothetical protein
MPVKESPDLGSRQSFRSSVEGLADALGGRIMGLLPCSAIGPFDKRIEPRSSSVAKKRHDDTLFSRVGKNVKPFSSAALPTPKPEDLLVGRQTRSNPSCQPGDSSQVAFNRRVAYRACLVRWGRVFMIDIPLAMTCDPPTGSGPGWTSLSPDIRKRETPLKRNTCKATENLHSPNGGAKQPLCNE